MKCQFCSNTATVHLTNIVDNKKKEVHLCEGCAENHKMVQNKETNLPGILEALIGHHLGQQTDALARLACPACGVKYMDFRAQGRLGCPHDYTAFQNGLEPLLQRIHRATRHVGKKPQNILCPDQPAKLVEIRRLLQAAIEAEAFEEAARLRDLLRQKEATDETR